MRILSIFFIWTVFLWSSNEGLALSQKQPPKQPKNQTKNQTKKVTVGELINRAIRETDQAKARSGKSKKQSAGSVKVNLEVVRPPQTNRYYSRTGGDAATYEALLDKQIRELYGLTKKFQGSPKRAEMWLRLAELYVEKADLVEAQVQEIYEHDLRDFQNKKRSTKPVLNLGKSVEYNRKSIQLYEWFLRDFPKDSRRPQALFFLGYNYYALGESKKGKRYYEELIRDFPGSPYVGEASFSLGDYYFDLDQWANAYREYAKVIKDQGHKLNDMATLKAAWCLYRLGKGRQAISYVESLAVKHERNPIGKDALKDLVVFYGEYGDPKNAAEYFQKLVGEGSQRFIENLAYYYSDRGYRDHAEVIFKKLIEMDPMSPKAFEYQNQIVMGLTHSKESNRYQKELFELVRGYGPQSDWGKRNGADRELAAQVKKARESQLRIAILRNHQTAQNSKAPYSRKMAKEGYEFYIQQLPDSENYVEMQFFFGELLYDMGEYERASQQYKWVLDNGGDSKFVPLAAQNLLIAAEKALPSEKDLIRQVGKTNQVVPLSSEMENFVRLGDWYVEKYPTSEKRVDVLYRIGRIYYLTNHFSEARKYFKIIIKEYPKTEQAVVSGNLLLDMFNVQKDYASIEKEGRELLELKGVGTSKAGSEIRNIVERAQFKRAQDLESGRDFFASAQGFASFATEYPSSSLKGLALFNAAVNFERAGHLQESREYYSRAATVEGKDNQNIARKASFQMAGIYRKAGKFEEAAGLYFSVSKQNVKDQEGAIAAKQAGVLFTALGDFQKASEAYLFLIQDKKSLKNLDPVILFSLGELYRKSKNSKTASQFYESYLAREPQGVMAVQSQFYLCEFILDQNSNSMASSCRARLDGLHVKLSEQEKREFAIYPARLRLMEARRVFSEIAGMRFSSDSADQQRKLKAKIEGLKKMNDLLGEVVRLDSPDEIVDSLSLLGDVNAHIYDSIMSAPMPKGLGADQVETYRKGVSDLALPFLEKAVSSYKSAYERGQDFQVYNESYQVARSFLSQQRPPLVDPSWEISEDLRWIYWVE